MERSGTRGFGLYYPDSAALYPGYAGLGMCGFGFSSLPFVFRKSFGGICGPLLCTYALPRYMIYKIVDEYNYDTKRI